MDFKFNFDVGDNDTKQKDPLDAKKDKTIISNDCTSKKFPLKSNNVLEVSDIAKCWLSKPDENLYEVDTLEVGQAISLQIVTPCDLTDQDESEKGRTGTTPSDLIPNVYEGGFKVWECTLDVLEYLSRHAEENIFKGKRVMDLGCGVGVLGTYAICSAQAGFVTFQDFNKDVITDATGPTSLLNFKIGHNLDGISTCQETGFQTKDSCKSDDSESANEEILSKATDSLLSDLWKDCKFLSSCKKRVNFMFGDWSDLIDCSNNNKYDVILSSETIYNTAYYSKLHSFLEKFLKRDGVIYMGSKSHYFGVGGGVLAWTEFVKSRDVFEMRTVHVIEANLKRVVLCMKFKSENKM
ncbi:histidine protein methyltransferase 1 homolog [Styela clava]